MQKFKLQFIRKSQLAFAMLMLATLAFVWIYADKVKWHERNVERIILANHVLHSYQELSILVGWELGAISESILPGEDNALPEPGPGASTLREAVSNVRQGIENEADLTGTGDASAKLARVTEIESLVEDIIRSRELVERALYEGRAGWCGPRGCCGAGCAFAAVLPSYKAASQDRSGSSPRSSEPPRLSGEQG